MFSWIINLFICSIKLPIRADDLVSEDNCVVPCPVDCTVSQWTEWTTCSRSCDLGKPIAFHIKLQYLWPGLNSVLSRFFNWSRSRASSKREIRFLPGYQTRSRNVLIHPANRGRQCPETLIQLRPCPFVECFHWAVSDWSPCTIEVRQYWIFSRNVVLIQIHHQIRALFLTWYIRTHKMLRINALSPFVVITYAYVLIEPSKQNIRSLSQ